MVKGPDPSARWPGSMARSDSGATFDKDLTSVGLDFPTLKTRVILAPTG